MSDPHAPYRARDGEKSEKEESFPETAEEAGTTERRNGSTPPETDTRNTGPTTHKEYERRYGVDIDTPGEVETLQRLERASGTRRVQQWADEGIPIEAMGSKPEMAAFRKHEGTPVPWDIEHRNEQSKRRNTVVQRTTGPAGETSEVPDELRTALSSPGRQLDDEVRAVKEKQFGSSFEHVRLHAGPRATVATDAIDAAACTVGNHILVNDPDFDPQSPRGDYVLTHELAHVEQQPDGAVNRLPKADAGLQIDPDPQLEQAAEETARRVLKGTSGATGSRRTAETAVSVQRMDPDQLDRQLSQLAVSPAPDPEAGSPLFRLFREYYRLRDLLDQMYAAEHQRCVEAARFRDSYARDAGVQVFNRIFRSVGVEGSDRRMGRLARIEEDITVAGFAEERLRNWHRNLDSLHELREGLEHGIDWLRWLLQAEMNDEVQLLPELERENYHELSNAALDTREEVRLINQSWDRELTERGAQVEAIREISRALGVPHLGSSGRSLSHITNLVRENPRAFYPFIYYPRPFAPLGGNPREFHPFIQYPSGPDSPGQ